MSFPSHEAYLAELIARLGRGEPVSLSGSSPRDAFTRWLATETSTFLKWLTGEIRVRRVCVHERWHPPESGHEIVWFDYQHGFTGRVFCAHAWNLRDDVLLLRYSEDNEREIWAEIGGDIVREGDRFRIQRFAFGGLATQNVG